MRTGRALGKPPSTANMVVSPREHSMPAMRFLLIPIRTNKQGQQLNVGKDGPEYLAIVNTMTMHPEDMKELGIVTGATIRVRTEIGEAEFQCKEANVPRGLLFVPYGPPTCKLMGGETDGTGMPTSKGWDVEVEVVRPTV